MHADERVLTHNIPAIHNAENRWAPNTRITDLCSIIEEAVIATLVSASSIVKTFEVR